MAIHHSPGGALLIGYPAMMSPTPAFASAASRRSIETRPTSLPDSRPTTPRRTGTRAPASCSLTSPTRWSRRGTGTLSVLYSAAMPSNPSDLDSQSMSPGQPPSCPVLCGASWRAQRARRALYAGGRPPPSSSALSSHSSARSKSPSRSHVSTRSKAASMRAWCETSRATRPSHSRPTDSRATPKGSCRRPGGSFIGRSDGRATRTFRRRTPKRPIRAVIAAHHPDKGIASLGSLTLNSCADHVVDTTPPAECWNRKGRPPRAWGEARTNRTMADAGDLQSCAPEPR